MGACAPMATAGLPQSVRSGLGRALGDWTRAHDGARQTGRQWGAGGHVDERPQPQGRGQRQGEATGLGRQ